MADYLSREQFTRPSLVCQELRAEKIHILISFFTEVNEEGTEAAAATAIMMTRSLIIEQEPVEFRADHPFMFAIRHEPTGLITFMGRVAHP